MHHPQSLSLLHEHRHLHSPYTHNKGYASLISLSSITSLFDCLHWPNIQVLMSLSFLATLQIIGVLCVHSQLSHCYSTFIVLVVIVICLALVNKVKPDHIVRRSHSLTHTSHFFYVILLWYECKVGFVSMIWRLWLKLSWSMFEGLPFQSSVDIKSSATLKFPWSYIVL